MTSDTRTDYAYVVNPYLEATNPAPIAMAKEWGNKYSGKHGPLLSLTQGVPSIAPDDEFMNHLAREAREPANATYGVLTGEPSLRKAFAKDVQTTYQTDKVEDLNVGITAGCNMAAQVTFQAIAKAGDEVVLPSPWYFNHEMCLDMLGIKIVPLPCQHNPQEGGFTPDPRDAEKLITKRTRAIVLVTPNNPTGSIYSHDLIESFYLLCKKASIALILDETYRDFLSPAQQPAHKLFSLPDWETTLISLYSFSKSYAIPGHRVGALIGSSDLVGKQISKVLDTMIICAPVAAQKTVAWAIAEPSQVKWRNDRRDELLNRAKLFSQVINAVNARISEERGKDKTPPAYEIDGLGSYYAFLRNPYLGDGIQQERLGRLLAAEVGVITLPGSFFGQGVILDASSGKRVKDPDDAKDQHLRISIANILDDGIRAMEERLVQLDRLIRDGLR